MYFNHQHSLIVVMQDTNLFESPPSPFHPPPLCNASTSSEVHRASQSTIYRTQCREPLVVDHFIASDKLLIHQRGTFHARSDLLMREAFSIQIHLEDYQLIRFLW